MNPLHAQHIRLSPDVMARRVGNELFILNVNTESYFGLDEIGSRMFTLLTAGASIGEAITQLETEYSVEPDVLSRDVEGLINELARHQLIQLVASPEP